jgi:hypothetical protein
MSDLERLSDDVLELQDDMSHVKEKLVAHETRFGNGIHVMGEMKGRIEVVEKKVEPKAPDWLKLMLAGLSVVGVLMGAQLWLTDRFNDRPTDQEMESRIAPIRAAQKDTANDVGDIRQSQAAQQTSIKTIETVQAKQGDKIDIILDRLPERRSH